MWKHLWLETWLSALLRLGRELRFFSYFWKMFILKEPRKPQDMGRKLPGPWSRKVWPIIQESTLSPQYAYLLIQLKIINWGKKNGVCRDDNSDGKIRQITLIKINVVKLLNPKPYFFFFFNYWSPLPWLYCHLKYHCNTGKIWFFYTIDCALHEYKWCHQMEGRSIGQNLLMI